MLKQYIRAEVKATIFHIYVNKSPSPDDFGSGFFKAFWSVVGEDVTNVILEFFDNVQMLKQLNSTIIALIPKVEDLLNASQYKPISCCNTIYKCISKIICTRIKEVLPTIVTKNQAAFVEG